MAKTIITHDGSFHADDCFAVATLLLCFKDEVVHVLRSRDEKIIATGDIVVDIGKKYSRDTGRFDHHQEDFEEKRENGIPYAAFGLVWKEYGNILTGSADITDIVDQKLVAPLDASDSGVDTYSILKNTAPYDVPKMIAGMNPVFFENTSPEGKFESFMKAVEIAKYILEREIVCAKEKVQTKKILKDAYEAAEDKKIIILNEKVYWEDDAIDLCPETFFIVYPYTETVWAAKAVRKNQGTFASRKNFPETWGGKSNHDLQEISGISDARFCHKALFMASADSKESAIKLAQNALEE